MSPVRTVSAVRTGHGERQVDEHPAVQRQILYRLRFDDFAEAGVLRLERLGGGDHGDGLALLGDAEHQVERHILPDLDGDFARQRREARRRGLDGVVCRR
jgi:hypothetical protein